MESLPTDLLILLAIGSAIPLAVAQLTKWHAPTWARNVVNLLAATTVAAVQQGIDLLASDGDAEWGWQRFATGILVTWLMSTFAYMKLWKDLPITSAIQRKGGVIGGTSDYISLDTPPVKAEGAIAGPNAITHAHAPVAATVAPSTSPGSYQDGDGGIVTAWVHSEGAVGPQGEAGAVGPQGATGERGESGFDPVPDFIPRIADSHGARLDEATAQHDAHFAQHHHVAPKPPVPPAPLAPQLDELFGDRPEPVAEPEPAEDAPAGYPTSNKLQD